MVECMSLIYIVEDSLDLALPNRDGLDVCRDLKSDSAYQKIPSIMVPGVWSKTTSLPGWTSARMAISAKPFISMNLPPGCAPSCAARSSTISGARQDLGGTQHGRAYPQLARKTRQSQRPDPKSARRGLLLQSPPGAG